MTELERLRLLNAAANADLAAADARSAGAVFRRIAEGHAPGHRRALAVEYLGKAAGRLGESLAHATADDDARDQPSG